MVERSIEPEVEKVFKAIENGRNFILEGGAGSGKTYSLVSIIRRISSEEPNKSIVCITYTNNAVAEIRSRVNNDKLWVSTIHEFIWHVIGKFQQEIKECLIELINNEEQKLFLKPREFSNQELVSLKYFLNIYIDYDERYSMSIDENNRVQISHDHILILAENMFSKYVKLCDILADIANYIFVDEYQDTSPLIAKILLKHLQKSSKKNIIGFFGDSMQAIYDNGVGDLESYGLEKIQKTQNRRNPQKIIDLANNFRCDRLIQTPSDDVSAPNINPETLTVIPGTVKFVYGDGLKQLEDLRNSPMYKSLGFDDPLKTKELRLTHKLNSETAGFPELYKLYNSDIFIKLVTKLKDKINTSEIDISGKTFAEIVREAQVLTKRGGPPLISKILSEPTYSHFYKKIKFNLFKDVINKIGINKDSLFSYRSNVTENRYESGADRDRILRRLDSIYELTELYKDNKINKFLNLTKYKIGSEKDKINLDNIMSQISGNSNELTIENVLDIAIENRLILEDDLFDNFIDNNGYYLWSQIKKIPFQEYVRSIEYLREYVSVMTQHKVKGSEYDNVLVLLDNGRWNKYNFDTLFGQGSNNEKVQNRTKKLFYVAITRAKKNLIIYMPKNDSRIIEKAKCFFEKDDIIDVMSLVDE